MQPRDRLTTKEIQVATLVWQGLTNRDIAGVLNTSEQVVKNYLRTAFDKLGVWTRLELALYVASHGGASWHLELGLAPLPPPNDNVNVSVGPGGSSTVHAWKVRADERVHPLVGLGKAASAARGT
jgi:DNA-binding CsgD family transcriptional regulator